jgi:hypothetical protein
VVIGTDSIGSCLILREGTEVNYTDRLENQFLCACYLFTIDRLFPSIVEMFRINFYRVSLDFIQPVSSQESEQ